jgi:hypothetical protein
MKCADQPVSHSPGDSAAADGAPNKAPDLVLGLAMTTSFKVLTESRPELRHTPIELDVASILYPFLVIEAKSEKGSPGFEAVEAQTAFPIRTFLRIQAQLKAQGTFSLDPLVWFMAFSGEQWHVYGCVMEENKYVRLRE